MTKQKTLDGKELHIRKIYIYDSEGNSSTIPYKVKQADKNDPSVA